MANHIPSFLNGAKCAIRIGGVTVAFAQNLSFSDDMSVAPVGQIGSYANQALEPTGYLARGSLTITHYSDHVVNAINQSAVAGGDVTDPIATGITDKFPAGTGRDGNSLLISEFFSPAQMILSRDFDVTVFERSLFDTDDVTPGEQLGLENINNASIAMYVIRGCRFTNYSISFSPGQLVNENVSFIARGVEDSRAAKII